MKFIVKVADKVVFAVKVGEHYSKKNYPAVQDTINRFLNDANVEHYKLVLEH